MVILIPPTQKKDQPQTAESRLASCQRLIRAAVSHCGCRDRPGLDFEDMLQEATIEVWRELKDYPTAPTGYIWQVAYRAAIHALRRAHLCGPSTRNFQIVSLEALVESIESGLETIEDPLAGRRWGELPDPTQDIAVARAMYQELWEGLTPRQQQVLNLRLHQYSESEAGAALGISQASVHRHVVAIRGKARAAWDDGPQMVARAELTPEEARDAVLSLSKEHRRERRRQKMSRYYARHREQVNARRRAKRRKKATLTTAHGLGRDALGMGDIPGQGVRGLPQYCDKAQRR